MESKENKPSREQVLKIIKKLKSPAPNKSNISSSNLQETDHVCMHSLCAIMPYYIALFRGVAPKHLGLCRDGPKAYVQCLDPCEYTGGGTVIFEIERKPHP